MKKNKIDKTPDLLERYEYFKNIQLLKELEDEKVENDEIVEQKVIILIDE